MPTPATPRRTRTPSSTGTARRLLPTALIRCPQPSVGRGSVRLLPRGAGRVRARTSPQPPGARSADDELEVDRRALAVVLVLAGLVVELDRGSGELHEALARDLLLYDDRRGRDRVVRSVATSACGQDTGDLDLHLAD